MKSCFWTCKWQPLTGEREDRKGLVATMVELRREISRPRDKGEERGFVRMVYTPGHRGVAPNAVADAIADLPNPSDPIDPMP